MAVVVFLITVTGTIADVTALWPSSTLSIHVLGEDVACDLNIAWGVDELSLLGWLLLISGAVISPVRPRIAAVLAGAAGALALVAAGSFGETWLERSLLGQLPDVGEGVRGVMGCQTIPTQQLATLIDTELYIRAMMLYALAGLLLVLLAAVYPRDHVHVDARPWIRALKGLRWLAAVALAALTALIASAIPSLASAYHASAGHTSWLPLSEALGMGVLVSLVALIPTKYARATGLAFINLTAGVAFAQAAFVSQLRYGHTHVLKNPDATGTPRYGEDLEGPQRALLLDAFQYYIAVLIVCAVIWVASRLTLRLLRPPVGTTSPRLGEARNLRSSPRSGAANEDFD
jgi:hypothetical protein